ncbi:MAG: class I mannose-6-phosphate isomerase [Muribaculaceae bacterium]|nr:class I mannose-6-phosphate isomerase [Muribaculaceae bacterium]
MKAIKFQPYLKSVLWGGSKIAPFKGIDTDQKNIGESWEISGVAGHESVVAEGDDAGMTLPQIIDKYQARLVGEKVWKKFGNQFPLLIKLIDAQGDLSLQVHPDDALAGKRHNCAGKTEMWYIVQAEPGAHIFAGLGEQITPDDYERKVGDNTIMDVVACHEAAKGDMFFLPAGRIHAIGAGNFLAEIQQTSDITYRVYDFGRLDANGKPRELHTEQAKDAINYTVYPEYKGSYDRKAEVADLVKCEYFDVKRVIVDGEKKICHNEDSFTVVMNLGAGDAKIVTAAGETLLPQGATALVAAEDKEFSLVATGTEFLVATV